jgi:hypothetical protein
MPCACRRHTCGRRPSGSGRAESPGCLQVRHRGLCPAPRSRSARRLAGGRAVGRRCGHLKDEVLALAGGVNNPGDLSAASVGFSSWFRTQLALTCAISRVRRRRRNPRSILTSAATRAGRWLRTKVAASVVPRASESLRTGALRPRSRRFDPASVRARRAGPPLDHRCPERTQMSRPGRSRAEPCVLSTERLRWPSCYRSIR